MPPSSPQGLSYKSTSLTYEDIKSQKKIMKR
jgi:hypothetical protein